MTCVFVHDGIRFASWVGPGRDPEVAYLDARQLVITTAELRATGSVLFETGTSHNTLGGVRAGVIDAPVLHRLVHSMVDAVGAPRFQLEVTAGECVPLDGLCETARREPRPGTPADPEGNFLVEAGYVLQWISWDDVPRVGTLRRAVYLDDRFLLEAGTGPDGAVRIWPARGLMPQGLEFVTPSGQQALEIEERIASATAIAPPQQASDPVH